MQMSADDDFHKTLEQARQAKVSVELQTRGGEILKGLVSAVGKEFVVLGPLSGRDFFDAQVRVSDICAVCVQVRGR